MIAKCSDGDDLISRGQALKPCRESESGLSESKIFFQILFLGKWGVLKETYVLLSCLFRLGEGASF